MEKSAKQAILGTILVLTVILAASAVALVRYFSPGTEVMGLSEYYNVPEGEAMIILDDKIYERNALLLENHVYVDLNTIQQKFNHRFYWDLEECILTYTTPTEIIQTKIGTADYQVNQEKRQFAHPIVEMAGDSIYISLEFISNYSDIRYKEITIADKNGKETTQRVMITCAYGDYLYVDVEKKTQIRTSADRKSEILTELEPGAKLMLLDGGGTQEKGYLKVMSEDGIRGFVKKQHVGSGYYSKVSSTFNAPVYTSIRQTGIINLVWHVVTNMSANDNLAGMMANTKGVTVISPTWFSINSNEGTISSLASSEYVREAHDMGLKVWGLADNFSRDVSTYQVLSKTSTRSRLEDELVSEALRCGMDGINIDFEALSAETGPHFIEFLRELSVKCRNNSLVLSVDNYVPANYNRFYDYEEQGVLVDYVIIMAYDEHYAGSEEAGSVASISYVEGAISDTLKMVPAEKVIIAVPFYTRLWKESIVDGVEVLSSEALGMENAALTLQANNAVLTWDEETCQYYSEYEKEGTKYKIWMEEEESIDIKLNRIHEAGAAGVAGWRLGFERSAIWDVINKYVN